jgi:hypothetical protein
MIRLGAYPLLVHGNIDPRVPAATPAAAAIATAQ